ncbi:Transmembrane protein 19 [Apophysomyces ossiformis]|uniref:Transmembrane protein 19 n=1 Tax=Apophysomyces ossiformis TaxID=679940 RepID=A0A8H7BUY0_9FUNG|nr:Transmembrane protein 19 [Apophysomyces ossiformis]
MTFKAETKKKLECDYEQSSERNIIQVICNGLMGGITVTLFQLYAESSTTCYNLSRWGTILLWANVGHYACCAGDTWASELGILNKHQPFLITRFKRVPPGTNGGVSPLGLAASIAGGTVIGLSGAIAVALDKRCIVFPWQLVLLGTVAGLGGSLIDSLLGATVQCSLYSQKQKMIIPKERRDQDTVIISGYDLLDNHQVRLALETEDKGVNMKTGQFRILIAHGMFEWTSRLMVLYQLKTGKKNYCST